MVWTVSVWMGFPFLPVWEAGDSQAPCLAIWVELGWSGLNSLCPPACVWGWGLPPCLRTLIPSHRRGERSLCFTDVLVPGQAQIPRPHAWFLYKAVLSVNSLCFCWLFTLSIYSAAILCLFFSAVSWCDACLFSLWDECALRGMAVDGVF